MELNLDNVLAFLFQPVISGSLLICFLYITPIWVAKLIVILGVSTSLLIYVNDLYKVRGEWPGITKDDIAVITGGANGLGLEIVRLLRQRGVNCVVIDKEAMSNDSLGVHFIQCDLSDQSKLLETIKSIKESVGSPTILVNNAAMRHSESLQQLSYKQMQLLTTVNTLTPAVLMKELLDTNGKLYTINISSILGLVSPANLSFYSATKASLISLHESISHECGSNLKRFLLVTPGQLDTKMFSDVEPPKQFIAPVVKADLLAQKIVQCIERGERGTLYSPIYTYFIPILKLLPYGISEFARWFSEMDNSVKN